MTKSSYINQVCKELGIKQGELAEMMGYKLSFIRQVSADESRLTLPMRKHLETLIENHKLRKDDL